MSSLKESALRTWLNANWLTIKHCLPFALLVVGSMFYVCFAFRLHWIVLWTVSLGEITVTITMTTILMYALFFPLVIGAATVDYLRKQLTKR